MMHRNYHPYYEHTQGYYDHNHDRYGHPANCCREEVCGCPMKLSANCVIYDGNDMLTLDIRKGDRLEEILKVIDRAFAPATLPLETVEADIATSESYTAPLSALTVEEPPQTEPLSYEVAEVQEKSMQQTEWFFGSIQCVLEKEPKEVLSVTYCGIELEPTGFSVDNNILYVNTDLYGLELEDDDPIKVVYSA